MTKFEHVMRAAAVCAVALFLAAPPAAPQGTQLAAMPPAPPPQGVDQKTHHLKIGRAHV